MNNLEALRDAIDNKDMAKLYLWLQDYASSHNIGNSWTINGCEEYLLSEHKESKYLICELCEYFWRNRDIDEYGCPGQKEGCWKYKRS